MCSHRHTCVPLCVHVKRRHGEGERKSLLQVPGPRQGPESLLTEDPRPQSDWVLPPLPQASKDPRVLQGSQELLVMCAFSAWNQ